MGVVYCATNKINGKKYIGKTIKSLNDRRKIHEMHARYSNDSSPVFHTAIRKYGTDSFVWDVLFASNNVAALSIVEMGFISDLNTRYPNGYNMTDGGEGVTGRIVTQFTIDKIRAAQIGRPKSEEYKDNHRRLFCSRVYTEEERRLRSERAKQKAADPEYRKRMSDVQKGKKQSPETIAARVAAMTGYKHSEETKKKIGDSNRGKKRSKQTRALMSAKKIGRKLTPEHIAAIANGNRHPRGKYKIKRNKKSRLP